MFLEACIIGVLVGLIRKGSLKNFSNVKIRGWYLALIGLVMQFAVYKSELVPMVKGYLTYIYIGSALLLIITLILNFDKRGTWIILLGAILNIIVIYLNGIKMPIDMNGLELAGMADIATKISNGGVTQFIPLESVTNFTRFLGKYIVLPKPYPLAKVISIGDVLMSIGMIAFIQGEMIKDKYKPRKTTMVSLGYRSKI